MFLRFERYWFWPRDFPELLSAKECDNCLERAVQQGKWRNVGRYFPWSVNKHLRKWVIVEACRQDAMFETESDLEEWMDTSSEIVHSCSVKELNLLFKEIITRRMWRQFRQLSRYWSDKERSGNKCAERVRRWAITQASRHADEPTLADIVRHCPQDQLEPVCREVVRRGLWQVFQHLENPLQLSEDFRLHLVQEALENAKDDDRWQDFFPKILKSLGQLERQSLVTTMVTKRAWKAILSVLIHRVDIARDTLIRTLRQAALNSVDPSYLYRLLNFCPEEEVGALLQEAVEAGWWRSAVWLIGSEAITDQQRKWAVEETISRCPDDESIWKVTEYVSEEHVHALLFHEVRCGGDVRYVLKERLKDAELSTLLTLWAGSFVDLLQHGCCLSAGVLPLGQKMGVLFDGIVNCQVSFLVHILQQAEIMEADGNGREVHTFVCLPTDELEKVLCNAADQDQDQIDTGVLHKYFKLFYANRGAPNSFQRLDALSDLVILPMFCVQNVNPVLKNMALHLVLSQVDKSERRKSLSLRDHWWDVIQDTPSFHMWCEMRRAVFRAAVEQRQWSVVEQLADHNLEDDQRYWALREAMGERQADTLVVLADFGLSQRQLQRVHRQVAKHGQWDTFLRLLPRGVSVRQVRQDLETANPGRKRPLDKELEARYNDRVRELRVLERKLSTESRDFSTAVREHNWPAILRRFRRRRYPGREDELTVALEAALGAGAWLVVAQLVRAGPDDGQCDHLFNLALDRHQWGLARVLLEREGEFRLTTLRRARRRRPTPPFLNHGGVSSALCGQKLPLLMAEWQWGLVAKALHHDIGDELRRQVLQEALCRRQGGVVASCLSILTSRMSVEERQQVFSRALAEDQWLVVRTMVREKDALGLKHRDTAFLAAVERELWEEVDECVHHGADINARDEEGHTLVQQYARTKQWSKVEGLVSLGADQFLKDNDGYCAIHRIVLSRDEAITSHNALKTLVEFHGDINQPDPKGLTPLYRFIQYGLPDMVECAMLWGRNVGARTAFRGKTVLHFMCERERWDTLRYIVGRGADPLALDLEGRSVLYYAVQNHKSYLELVRECVKLGVTPYQPYINMLVRLGYFETGSPGMLSPVFYDPPIETAYNTTSLPVMKMLYESGACCNLEIFYLYSQPYRFVSRVCRSSGSKVRDLNFRDFENYLRHIATNPRSLQSLCRIVISLFVGPGKFQERERRVSTLPFLSRRMRAYVLFTDLIHPHFAATPRPTTDFQTSEEQESTRHV